jgi:hypothetical protein
VIGSERIWPNDIAMDEKAMAEVESQAAECLAFIPAEAGILAGKETR